VSQQRLGPAEAWARLEAGNRRWAGGAPVRPNQDAETRRRVSERQDPFATIVSCIDSRVPAEVVFDQGLGDLFVVRTGAQTIDSLVTASIQFGPLANGTPLIVVVGHEHCGAVTAAVNAIRSGERLPGQLDEIVDSLRPAYHAATADWGEAVGGGHDHDLIDEVVRAQVLGTAATLADDGPLGALIASGDLAIVGAYYGLGDGRITRLHAIGLDG
jgi:carbonic anhydrase